MQVVDDIEVTPQQLLFLHSKTAMVDQLRSRTMVPAGNARSAADACTATMPEQQSNARSGFMEGQKTTSSQVAGGANHAPQQNTEMTAPWYSHCR